MFADGIMPCDLDEHALAKALDHATEVACMAAAAKDTKTQ